MEILNISALLTLFFSAVSCNNAWLTELPDTRQLNSLAFIGTVNSAYYIQPYISILTSRKQSMSITEQLEAGIRVLEISVRRTNNVFAMHDSHEYLNLMFGDVVGEVYIYLKKNPGEFVFMVMREDWLPEISKMTVCEILEQKYFKDWPEFFVEHWTDTDIIGQYRGKVLLADDVLGDKEGKFSGCLKKLPNPIPRIGSFDDFLHGFHNPKNNLSVYLAEFPTQTLIDTVIASNT